LTITDELRSEGMARDIVRNIQEARKQMGCDIMDRIVIEITGDYPKQWADYIQTETLCHIADDIANVLTTVELQDDNGDAIVIKIGKENL
jgi:isoleucyl-tRNA synthetase